MTIKKQKTYIFLFATCALIALVHKQLDAADLRIFAPVSQFSENSIFKASVLIDDNATPVNAFSGKVTFPIDQLEFVSVETEKSILNFWTKEPTYDASSNTISFEGVVIEQNGFRDARGELFTIVFKTLRPGEPTVEFVSGAIYAHDGNGTNILNTLRSMKFAVLPTNECIGSAEECAAALAPLQANLQQEKAQDAYQIINTKSAENIPTAFEFAILVLLIVTLLTVGTLFIYLVAVKKHPNTDPQTYAESLGFLKSRLKTAKVTDIVSRPRLFLLPVLLSPVLAVLVTFVLFIFFESVACTMFASTYSFNSLNFSLIYIVNLLVYMTGLYLTYILLFKNNFPGMRYFIGALVGAVLILFLIQSGYENYREIIYTSCIVR